MALIARIASDDGPGWGFVEDHLLYPVSTPGLTEAISSGDSLSAFFSSRGEPLELRSIRLLAPVLQPPQFLGVGLNYLDHAQETGAAVPPEPVTFGLMSNAIIGDGEPIVVPDFSRQVDWEAELGIVVGRRGRDIPESEALDHVAGYTIINDVSARDVQMAEGQWGRAKSFDTFKPMGPWIATTDTLGDGSGLEISLWVNDELKQRSNTSKLIFSVPELISLISRAITLFPGSVITTGTPHGVGFLRDPPEFLEPGDVVTVEIEGIGRLSNPVVRV